MFNVQGKAFITNLKEITPKLITGTVYTFRKEDEEFKTTFIKCKIVGNAITNLILNLLSTIVSSYQVILIICFLDIIGILMLLNLLMISKKKYQMKK